MESREDIGRARRVVVKVGSSSLSSAEGGIDAARLQALVNVLATVQRAGREVVLVSSGAIACGLAPLGLTRRPRDLATQQAAASVGQGLLVHRYTDAFADQSVRVGQILLTVDDVTRRGHYRNAYRTFAKLLELGVVPIVNENDTVATSEIRFGDNDRLAALVAHLVHADLLVLLSDVDALYDGDPRDDSSTRIATVRGMRELEQVRMSKARSSLGTGGMVTKLEAVRMSTQAGIPVLLTSAVDAGDGLEGGEVGTLFHPTGRRRPTRLLWLAHVTEPRGSLVLDDGAVQAVTQRRASLLPPGIVEVRGIFVAGDPVDLVTAAGDPVARGLVNYDSDELPRLLGRTTHALKAELGAAYEREVVHRDDLALLPR
ncbi:MAG: glutamate 5-kinase [Nocardioidaceae bacterium]